MTENLEDAPQRRPWLRAGVTVAAVAVLVGVTLAARQGVGRFKAGLDDGVDGRGGGSPAGGTF